MKDSGLGSFLAGLAIGGLIGAALGCCFLSPSSGEEMREHVGEFVGERRAAFDDAVTRAARPPKGSRRDGGRVRCLCPGRGETASQGGTAPEAAA